MNVHPEIRSGSMLCLEDVSVSADGHLALDRLSLTVDIGELRCLVIPSGADKATLLDVITGKMQPDSGKARFDAGTVSRQHGEPGTASLGIGRKPGDTTVFEMHTVENNLVLAMLKRKGIWFALNFKPSSAQRRRVAEILKVIGLNELRDQRARELSHGQKQWLKIGMLMAQVPRLLVIDEPAAGMNPQESQDLMNLVRRIRDSGLTIVLMVVFTTIIARTPLGRSQRACEQDRDMAALIGITLITSPPASGSGVIG